MVNSMDKFHYEADIVIIGFGGAGGCAAIEAVEEGAKVIILEKQPEETHYSNTRMSGGGYHSPDPLGDENSLREYAKAMFSGDNLPSKLAGEEPDFSEELAKAWVEYAPFNDSFMKGIDPDYKSIYSGGAAFPHFPGAELSKYQVMTSTYTGKFPDHEVKYKNTKDLPKLKKEAGEAFFACILHGVRERGVEVHYQTKGLDLMTNDQGEVIGVIGDKDGEEITYLSKKAVLLTCGGYEYNHRMRSAFLEGPGKEGWAFYGSPENTGDGLKMALKLGAALSKCGSAAARIITALPIRRYDLKIGLATPSVGKPHQLVVDNYGRRYANERSVTKDPSRYIFFKEALKFDISSLIYPRVPSWMIFDETLQVKGPLINTRQTDYHSIPWTDDNLEAVRQGWILEAKTIFQLGQRIKEHTDNRNLMDPSLLGETVSQFNEYCKQGEDLDYGRERDTLGPVETSPFYALPLYVGGPNTKGGLLTNGKRQVLNWEGRPIPRLYSAGELSSAFKFVYHSGGNLAECIAFGRLAGKNAVKERPICS